MIAKACPEYSLNKRSTLVAISGSGNVAQYTALKVIELGATVVSLSDSKGSLVVSGEGGFTPDIIETIAQLKLKGGALESLQLDSQKYTYHAGDYRLPRNWRECDIDNYFSESQVNAPGLSFPKSTLHFLVLPKMKFPQKRRWRLSKQASKLSRKGPTWYIEFNFFFEKSG
jgi:Glutamate dehydrogenase/leucine dehydrogenase